MFFFFSLNYVVYPVRKIRAAAEDCDVSSLPDVGVSGDFFSSASSEKTSLFEGPSGLYYSFHAAVRKNV